MPKKKKTKTQNRWGIFVQDQKSTHIQTVTKWHSKKLPLLTTERKKNKVKKQNKTTQNRSRQPQNETMLEEMRR